MSKSIEPIPHEVDPHEEKIADMHNGFGYAHGWNMMQREKELAKKTTDADQPVTFDALSRLGLTTKQ